VTVRPETVRPETETQRTENQKKLNPVCVKQSPRTANCHLKDFLPPRSSARRLPTGRVPSSAVEVPVSPGLTPALSHLIAGPPRGRVLIPRVLVVKAIRETRGGGGDQNRDRQSEPIHSCGHSTARVGVYRPSQAHHPDETCPRAQRQEPQHHAEDAPHAE
jgi:hypothetical protein